MLTKFLAAAFRRKPDPPAAEYVRGRYPAGGRDYIEHLGGIRWDRAPVPRFFHKCWPQTRAFLDGEREERCACGGVRLSPWRCWIERNSRRPETPEEKAERERMDVMDDLIEEFYRAEQALDGNRMAEIRDEIRRRMDAY